MGDADLLFTAHREGVFRYLRRIVGHRDAEELTQDVFLRVARGPVPEVDETRRRAWIFRIARNLALNQVRNARRRGTPAAVEDLPSTGMQELTAALREAIDRLAPGDRASFLLRETAGLSYADIAAATNLSPDAVRSRLHRARQQLRAALGPELTRHGVTPGVRLYDRPDRD